MHLIDFVLTRKKSLLLNKKYFHFFLSARKCKSGNFFAQLKSILVQSNYYSIEAQVPGFRASPLETLCFVNETVNVDFELQSGNTLHLSNSILLARP